MAFLRRFAFVYFRSTRDADDAIYGLDGCVADLLASIMGRFNLSPQLFKVALPLTGKSLATRAGACGWNGQRYAQLSALLWPVTPEIIEEALIAHLLIGHRGTVT